MTAAPYVCMDWRHVRELFEAGANRLRRTEKHLRLGEDHARTGQLLRCPFRKFLRLGIRMVRQNHRMIGDDARNPAITLNVLYRLVQVAAPA